MTYFNGVLNKFSFSVFGDYVYNFHSKEIPLRQMIGERPPEIEIIGPGSLFRFSLHAVFKKLMKAVEIGWRKCFIRLNPLE